MCRQYNDYGSIARDRAERNLNSVTFLGFDEGISEECGEESEDKDRAAEARERRMKAELFEIAEHERQCLQLAMRESETCLPEQTKGMLKVFVNVTDLCGQIYAARDIASRMK